MDDARRKEMDMTASQDRADDFLRGDFSKSVYAQRARDLVPMLKARQQQ
jgi:hypothetical protein